MYPLMLPSDDATVLPVRESHFDCTVAQRRIAFALTGMAVQASLDRCTAKLRRTLYGRTVYWSVLREGGTHGQDVPARDLPRNVGKIVSLKLFIIVRCV